jgi:hypothetical protein
LGGTWQSYLVLGGLVLLAGWVVYVLVKNSPRGPLRQPRRSSGVVVTEGGDVLSPAAWRQEAERLAAAGRYREALRARYRALVGDLAALGLLEEVPGRTSGEYDRLVRAQLPEIGREFSAATDLFERCWYGQEEAGNDEQRALGERARAMVSSVGAGRRGDQRDELASVP